MIEELNDLSRVCNWVDEQLVSGETMDTETTLAFERVVSRLHEDIRVETEPKLSWCPTCHGTGYVGDRAGPCPNPDCKSGRVFPEPKYPHIQRIHEAVGIE